MMRAILAIDQGTTNSKAVLVSETGEVLARGSAAVGISIQDSGSGFDETDNDRMFQPLYTTKAEGLGMGLAIARTIVGAHGGRLWAANNVDHGATFHFTLPVRTEETP